MAAGVPRFEANTESCGWHLPRLPANHHAARRVAAHHGNEAVTGHVVGADRPPALLGIEEALPSPRAPLNLDGGIDGGLHGDGDRGAGDPVATCSSPSCVTVEAHAAWVRAQSPCGGGQKSPHFLCI